MSSEQPHAADRRVTPRFPTSFEAELAAGSAVVSLTVHDLSMTGCGVEILTPDPDLADRLGALGMLRLPWCRKRKAPSCRFCCATSAWKTTSSAMDCGSRNCRHDRRAS